MPRPVIGITGRSVQAARIGVVPAYEDARAEAFMSEIATQLINAGAVAVYLPDTAPEAAVEILDGLVLTGGADINPRRYGQVPSQHVTYIDGRRDRFEFDAFSAAVAREIPVLGICRGQQLINVTFGGTLIQDLPVGVGESHASQIYERDQRIHSVDFVEGSVFEQIYGNSVGVNSYHHQCIDRLGEGLRVAGAASDGVIEAIEHMTLPITAVQWHPESFAKDPIFPWFVEQATFLHDRKA